MKRKSLFMPSKNTQNFGYKSGKALQYHIYAAHVSGKFDENCPACVELQKKSGCDIVNKGDQ